MAAAEELVDVKDHARNANLPLTATCVQNFRIILGKYLNVKLTTHIIRADSSRTRIETWRGTRGERPVARDEKHEDL